MVVVEHFTQRRAAAELLNAVGTNLNPRKSYRSDVLDRLTIVSAPSNGCIANMKFERRRRNWRVKVRQIHWRIQPLSSGQQANGKSCYRGQSAHASKELTA